MRGCGLWPPSPAPAPRRGCGLRPPCPAPALLCGLLAAVAAVAEGGRALPQLSDDIPFRVNWPGTELSLVGTAGPARPGSGSEPSEGGLGGAGPPPEGARQPGENPGGSCAGSGVGRAGREGAGAAIEA